MPEQPNMERVPDSYEQQEPSEIYDALDFPKHEEGDEGAPRDSEPGDANTRDEDREGA